MTAVELPYEHVARAAIEATPQHMLAAAAKLIVDLTDPDDCSFDHHGGCRRMATSTCSPEKHAHSATPREWAKAHAAMGESA
ncbi:hypothetical protein M1D93_14875 [Arthrobacter sp. Z1-9]